MAELEVVGNEIGKARYAVAPRGGTQIGTEHQRT